MVPSRNAAADIIIGVTILVVATGIIWYLGFNDTRVKNVAGHEETAVSLLDTVPKTQESYIDKVESDDWRFELRNCQLQGNTVNCSLFVTSKALDRELTIYTGNYSQGSRMFDGEGNEYSADNIKIANKAGKSVSHLMVVDRSIPVSLSFNDVPADISEIALLEISRRINYKQIDPIQFRNISLVK